MAAMAGFFNDMSPGKLDHLGDIYSPGMTFRTRSTRSAASPNCAWSLPSGSDGNRPGSLFKLLDAHGDDHTGFLLWTMKYPQNGRIPGQIRGISRFRFAPDRRVSEQRDQWDASFLLYGEHPVLGWLMQKIKAARSSSRKRQARDARPTAILAANTKNEADDQTTKTGLLTKKNSCVAVALAEAGELAVASRSALVPSGSLSGFGGKPCVALDEIQLFELWQDILHETQDVVRLVLVFRRAFRLPVADGELGDPDRFSIEFVDRVQALDQAIRHWDRHRNGRRRNRPASSRFFAPSMKAFIHSLSGCTHAGLPRRRPVS